MTSLRRNACPSIARPMATGDGLLARLPPAGHLPQSTLLAVCAAARRFGNGIIEITARGSIQVRGLSAATAAPFAAALREARLVDRRPAILVPPLAGLDPTEVTDVRPLAGAIASAVAAAGIAAGLAPKLAVVLDGGGRLHLDAIEADLRLVADKDGRFDVMLGGAAGAVRPVGRIPAGGAVDAVVAVLGLIASRGPLARGGDLDPAVAAAAIGAEPGHPTRRAQMRAEPIGVHRTRDGLCAVGIGLPFGQADAAHLATLVGAAVERGAVGFAPAPHRSLLALGIRPSGAEPFRARAAASGFIITADDPRRSVVACAGAPACASARMPARAAAAAIAKAAAPVLDGSLTIHISGCAKGCAHPAAAGLTFIGTDDGAAFVAAGRASDPAPVVLPARDLAVATGRIAAAIAARRRPGEHAADTVLRLDTAALVAAAMREPADA
jgi:precorrin-3B synthase